MKIKKKDIIKLTLAIFIYVFNNISGILGANSDFTNVWYYGCRWFGGTASTLSCNCSETAEEMYIQKHSITSLDIINIKINNCPSVRFGPNCISDLRNLRSISLNNDASVIFEQNSLSWYGYRDTIITGEKRFDLSVPSLKISIADSGIKSIASQTFEGRINEIDMENVQVDSIDAFAFTNLLQMEKLILKNTIIKDVKPQAFKKFGTEFLILDGVNVDYVPSRTFSDITVYRMFTVNNCKFTTVRPSAFIIHNPNSVTVTNTHIHQLDGEGFWINTRGDVLFRNNVFHSVNGEAFSGIIRNTDEVNNARTITFDSNTFSSLERHSLQVHPSLEARFINLNLNQTCDCNDIFNNLKQSEFYNEIRCLNSDGEYVTVREYKSGSCSILTGYYTIIIVVCVLILVVGVVAIAFYMYYRLVYRSQKYGCKKGNNPPLSLIVPDGRTYKETEVHVIVERADLLTTDL